MAGTDLALLLLKLTTVVLVVLLVLRLMRGASAARRVFASRCALVALLLMPAIWLAMPPMPVPVPLAVSALIDPRLVMPADISAMPLPAALPATEQAFAAPQRAAWLGRLLLALYAAGVLLHGCRLALNLRQLKQVAAGARHVTLPNWQGALQRLHPANVGRPVRLLVSDAIASPYSWGWRHPVIVLDPHSLAQADPDAILAHELAHIGHHDWPVLMLARCLLALYWWHPLMYLLVRQLEHDTECAADNAVLAAGIAPSHYAHALVTVSRHAFAQPATLANRIAARGATLMARIAALLEAHRPRGRVTARQWRGGALATLLLVTVVGSLKVRGEEVIWPSDLLQAGAANGASAAELLDALDNPNFTQLAKAMRARDFAQRHAVDIESFRQRAAIPALLLALRDPHPQVRRLAVWAFSEMRFPETAAAVAVLLADPDPGVRAEAAGALGDMDERRWLSAMIALLNDEHAYVRQRAAHALGDLQAAAAVPMLEARLLDRDEKVASEAKWALKEIRE